MTIYKTSIKLDYTNLECDLCGSDDIAETVEGYVCRACGIVQTLRKLQYDQPYKADVLQYARRLGSTQIGNKRERLISPHSRSLKRLNKYNKINDNEKIVYAKARREISRILSSLDLADYGSLKEMALVNFKETYGRLQSGSKYRNVEKLVAIILYFRFKLDTISVTNADIFKHTELTKKEFNNFYREVRAYYPNYMVRNRQKYISQKLLEITNHFELEMPFYFLSKKVLYRLWEGIKNTTDNVIAGLCASITTLCEYKEEVRISSICELLDIRMSTIQLQVKKRIFDRYRIPGFSTLVRSADLLEKFLVKIGLIEDEEPEIGLVKEEDVKEENDIIQVQLGDALQVFNPSNDHYLFESFDQNGAITYIYLEVYNHFASKVKSKKSSKASGVWFKLALEEFFPSKGPPVTT
ncbi:MAG: hypothetical protein ACFE94_18845 [Candidatus Hodarchaeota archaeon]